MGIVAFGLLVINGGLKFSFKDARLISFYKRLTSEETERTRIYVHTLSRFNFVPDSVHYKVNGGKVRI